MTTCVVVVGGEPTTQLVPGWLSPHPGALAPPEVIWIAADSGLDLLHALGQRADVVVGDFDSVSLEAWSRAIDDGAKIEQHDTAKDQTDFELALVAALGRGATRIVVVGGAGGRLDHLLANVAALSAPTLAEVEVEAWIGVSALRVIRRAATLDGSPGLVVSLEPWHGAAHGVTTDGLRWPLAGETLDPGIARGVSNEFVGQSATVSITAGVLLSVIPDASSLPGVVVGAVAAGIDWAVAPTVPVGDAVAPEVAR